MAGRRRRRTFAEIVEQVEREGGNAELLEEEPGGPGLRGDGTVVDPQGRVYERVRGTVSASRAHAAAAAGAVVVWDPCGCGGGCGFRWLDRAEVSALVGSGPPRVRRSGRRPVSGISEWHAADGSVLLLAEDSVFWGGLLA
ncbi:MAG TPA: hypothetical protein VFY14_13910 [Streptomyces sp.]|nr:hypothetical protein [Streptomyces sp.]